MQGSSLASCIRFIRGGDPDEYDMLSQPDTWDKTSVLPVMPDV